MTQIDIGRIEVGERLREELNVPLLAFAAEAERLGGILDAHHAARTAALRGPIVPAESGSAEPGPAAFA